MICVCACAVVAWPSTGSEVSGAAFQRQKELLENESKFLKAELEKLKEGSIKSQEELRFLRSEKANIQSHFEAEKVGRAQEGQNKSSKGLTLTCAVL